jgi:hypothetical protein
VAFSLLAGAPGGVAAWDAAAAAENAATAGHGAGLHPLRWLLAPWQLWSDPERFGVLPRVGPSLLLTVPFVIWGLVSRKVPRGRSLGAAALVLYLGWSLVARNARYLLPCLGVALVLTAWGLLWPGRRHRVLAAASLLVVAGLLSWNAVQATSVFSRLLLPSGFLAGRETPDDYLSSRRSFWPTYVRAAERLPPDARVLILGETRSLGLERTRLVGGPMDPSPLLWLERRTGAKSFAEAVERSGYTHVIVDMSGVYRLSREHDRYRGRDAEVLALLGWLQKNGQLLDRRKGIAIFRLPQPPG